MTEVRPHGTIRQVLARNDRPRGSAGLTPRSSASPNPYPRLRIPLGLVDDDGAQAAWLLVQHADRDPAFQRRWGSTTPVTRCNLSIQGMSLAQNPARAPPSTQRVSGRLVSGGYAAS
jgi:hypothetical protein